MQTLFLLACLLVVQADVRLPPKITQQPIAEIIYEQSAKDVKMTCEADGVPEVEYSWKKNNLDFELNEENITPEQGTGSFTFKELYATDEGYYQCFAKNQYGMAMSQISSVQRAVLGSFPTRQEPQEQEVNHGDELVLRCNAPKSFPVPTYKWALAADMADKNPADIVENQRIMWDLNGDLHFANVEPTDFQGGRIYNCKVYNPHLRTEKGGSESKIIVNAGSPALTLPVKKYGPEPTVVVLAGEVLTVQCLFSGFPTPNVQFTRVGSALPYSKYSSEKFGSVMKITNMQEADEGRYKCTGDNNQGEKEYEFNVDVQVKPHFVKVDDQPHNINMTEGEDATFRCAAVAEPEAETQWYKNGKPIDSADPGVRMLVSEDGKKLTIKDLCKTCSNGQTDLMVIQCNASNVHGYAFAEGYLNVLLKTVLVEKPGDISMSTWDDEVMFHCAAEGDDSTPIKITWYFNDAEIDTTNKAYTVVEGEGLLVDAVLLDNEEKNKAAGKYTCKATNGLSSEIAEAFLTLPSDPAPVIKESSINWVLIIVIVVVVLLLLILLLIFCCLCMQRNKGDEYPVDEKEKKAGLNPEKELADNGFHDYQRPEAQPFKGSRASLTSTIKLNDSDDEESLAEYGEPDTGKFNEDGSFLGEYTEKRRPRGGDSIV